MQCFIVISSNVIPSVVEGAVERSAPFSSLSNYTISKKFPIFVKMRTKTHRQNTTSHKTNKPKQIRIMKMEFYKMTRDEQYVSPSLESTSVNIENGFCQSPNGLDNYTEGDEAGFMGL